MTDAESPLIELVSLLSKIKIAEECGLSQDNVFAFFHYHATFWHLHLHFKYKLPILKDKFSVENVLRKLETQDYFKNTEFVVKCKIPEIANQLKELTEEERRQVREKIYQGDFESANFN